MDGGRKGVPLGPGRGVVIEAGGRLRGRAHSRPQLAKFPTSSFFLVSMLTTGSPALMNIEASALMYRNCGSRSLCVSRFSSDLLLDCSRHPAWRISPRTFVGDASCPWPASSSDSVTRDLEVHCSAGVIGSPASPSHLSRFSRADARPGSR